MTFTSVFALGAFVLANPATSALRGPTQSYEDATVLSRTTKRRATLTYSSQVTSLHEMKNRGPISWWRTRRGRPGPPPRDARTWVHPSELPSFDKLPASPVWPLRSRAARLTAVLMAAALVAGTTGLLIAKNASSSDTPLPAHIATTINALPANSRVAAAHTVDLTFTSQGQVSVVAAMVLPHDLAVTTSPIPESASITGSTTGHPNFAVKWIGRDQVMGFTIVRLGVKIPALTFAPLPATAPVVAVSPILKSSTRSPQFAWADTTLGDPKVNATGVISYLSTASDADTSSFVDAVAVNKAGQVVAVLSTEHLWYSAQFVARIAYIVATGRGCHSSLGIVAESAQGGGVAVVRVIPKTPAQWHFVKGDVITSLNGKQIGTYDDLVTELYLTPAYSIAKVSFVRNATVHHADMTLGCAL